MGNALKSLPLCTSLRSHLHPRKRRAQKPCGGLFFHRLTDFFFNLRPAKRLPQRSIQSIAFQISQRANRCIRSAELADRIDTHAADDSLSLRSDSEGKKHLLDSSERRRGLLQIADLLADTIGNIATKCLQVELSL